MQSINNTPLEKLIIFQFYERVCDRKRMVVDPVQNVLKY